MNELRKPEWSKALPEFGASFARATSDMTGRFYEQSQALASAIAEWNGEICQFVSHRLQRNGIAMGSMTNCQGLPEVFAIQGRWFQDAADDYLKKANKLMGVNGRFMLQLFESASQNPTQGTTETGQSAVSASGRVREPKVSEAAS
jgi:hypothetical protein